MISITTMNPFFLRIFIIVLMELIALGMLIPLSPYLARQYGADGLQVGLLMSVYSIIQCLISPFWGILSDRIGRKPVLIFNLAGTALSYLWFSFAPNLSHLFYSRALAGACGINVSTALAWIADKTSLQKRSSSMAFIGATFGLGFIIGPFLGGVLGFFQKENSFSIVAFGAFVICLIGFLIACLTFEESYTTKNQKNISHTDQKSIYTFFFSKLFQNSSLRKILLIFFILSLSLTLTEAPLFLLMKDDLNWPQSLSSLGFAYIGLILACSQGFFVRRLIPWQGEMIINKWGFVLLTVGFFGLCFPKIIFIAVAVTMMALGYAFSHACLTGAISILTRSSHQGKALGIYQSLSSLSRIIGPAVGGWMYRDFNHQAPFFMAGLLASFGLLFSFLFQKSIPSKGKTHLKSEYFKQIKNRTFFLKNIKFKKGKMQ